MTSQIRRLGAFMLLGLLPDRGHAQTTQDPGLAAAIAKIRAIDNHGHPQRALAEGETDSEWDSFPADAYEKARTPYLPVTVRPGNPRIVAAWKTLWQYPYKEVTEEHVQELLRTKRRVMQEKGDAYPSWVLDQAGVDMMISNRVTMGRGLPPNRFLWIPYGDAYMFPAPTSAMQLERPRYAGFYKGMENRAKLLLAESGKTAFPPTLKDWLSEVVTPALEKQKRGGAVALKFVAAYYRPLDFKPAPESVATAIYAAAVRGVAPGFEDYKKLQNFIFISVAHAAGRLQMPVHIHCGPGSGAQYNLEGAHPFHLEKAIVEVPETDFVLVHGGWPYSFQVTGLLMKSNVFVDFSALEYILTPRNLAEVLRHWMDYVPEKVLFGTDVVAGPPQASWEEFLLVNTRAARQALGMALTGMMADGEIGRERAIQLARMVLRDNTAKLHHLNQ